jgi:hypothetical protein
MRATIALTAVVIATLWAGPSMAQEQRITGTGQFCIKGPSGPVKCDYQTNEQCQQARPQSSEDRCVPRAQLDDTVGGPASSKSEATGMPGDQRD